MTTPVTPSLSITGRRFDPRQSRASPLSRDKTRFVRVTTTMAATGPLRLVYFAVRAKEPCRNDLGAVEFPTWTFPYNKSGSIPAKRARQPLSRSIQRADSSFGSFRFVFHKVQLAWPEVKRQGLVPLASSPCSTWATSSSLEAAICRYCADLVRASCPQTRWSGPSARRSSRSRGSSCAIHS